MAPETLINRELSWLEFNRRVLHEAGDPRNPLLERVNFSRIFSSNLDEFFMKRVGGLKRQVLARVASSGDSEMPPEAQLAEIRRHLLPILETQARLFTDRLRPELAEAGIALLDWPDLTPGEQEEANAYFRAHVFPVLTPLAVDPGHPFPYLSTSWGVLLRHPERPEEELFARVKVPDVLPSWIPVSAGPDGERQTRLVSLHQLIERNLNALFPGLEIAALLLFRITRNADVERDEEDAEDLLEMVTQELRERRFAKVVRIEHGPDPDPRILSLLLDELEVAPEDVYSLPIWLEYYSLKPVLELNRPQLRFAPHVPVVPKALQDEQANMLDLLREEDLLVHHPYESFTASVERFIRAAVEDPKVLAIKMTLYRTGDDSPFIPLLIRAAEAGKQVACLVELKARFDEAKNILVAQALENAGVHVVYGIVGLKTHCKLCLVVRQERAGVRSYVHIGTGNYHSQTALLYTDLGLFTARPEYTEDVVHLFHSLTGRSSFHDFKRLLVAPSNLKARFLAMIDREAERRREGRPCGIIAKMNSLEDREICEALERAAGQGVPIDLIVRGICCVRPVDGALRVLSVVGRFLEHSRVFYFRNGAEDALDGEFYLGSCDWMNRNLTRRVEAVSPVESRKLRQKLWEILQVTLEDRRQAWDLRPDGTYEQRSTEETGTLAALGTHAALLKLTAEREASAPQAASSPAQS